MATLYRDPLFQASTVTLRVYPPDRPPLTVKCSSHKYVTTRPDAHVAALRMCYGMVAPRLYEYDPRKGVLVTPTHPVLQSNRLFDPPDQYGSVRLDPQQHRCAVCNAPFGFLGPHNPAVWGGGNLGFLHIGCCGAVGVTVQPHCPV